jgi:hypothetical protein
MTDGTDVFDGGLRRLTPEGWRNLVPNRGRSLRVHS